MSNRSAGMLLALISILFGLAIAAAAEVNERKAAGTGPPTCLDGVRNQGESDVDCGGVQPCARCAIGQACKVDGDCLSGACSRGLCNCGKRSFTFSLSSNEGGYGDSAEWPGGTQTQTSSPGCSVTIVNPDRNVELVCKLAGPFSVKSFKGFAACAGTGGEDGDGCAPVSCPPAGVGSCCEGRPSCSAALNGFAKAQFSVECRP